MVITRRDWICGGVIALLVFIALSMAMGAPEPLQRDTQTKALIQSELDLKSVTLTLGSVTVSDAAGIRTFTLGSTNGTKIGATGDKMGFLGATPIVRPSSTTDLRQALINLGLYTTGGATPLNLNGGAFTAASITGTTGTFSSTMGITGNTTIGGTLGITGATTGSSLTLSGNESVGGTLNVTGASTFTTIAGTNQTLSGTLGVTGNTTLGGTLGITGATSGAAFTFSGNGTVGGTLGVTGNSTFGGTLGITGALSGSSYSFSGNGLVGGTLGVTGTSTLAAVNATNGSFSGQLSVTGDSSFGNGEFDGTLVTIGEAQFGDALDVIGLANLRGGLAVTGASAIQGLTATTIAGTSGTFSSTLGVTGNATVGGTTTSTGAITGPINPTSGSVLNYIDVRWYGVDVTGATDSTAAFNNARSAARSAALPLKLTGTIKITSTLAITAAERWIGDAKSFPDGVPASGSTLKWAGTGGGTLVTINAVARGIIFDGIIFDGDDIADIGLLFDSTDYATVTNNYFRGFSITCVKIIATLTDSASHNSFEDNVFVGLTSGNSLIWLHGGAAGNSCHNHFSNTTLITNGNRQGIRLGNCDNNRFFGVYHFSTDYTTSKAVIVEPLIGAGMPVSNYFYHLQGVWEQPGTTEINPGIIFGYDKANAQEDPITNGTALGPVYYSDGRITGLSGSSALRVRAYNNANISIPSGVATVVTLNSERWDTNAMHSTSSNTSRLTAQESGSYSISCNLSYEINATGFRFMSIVLNNATTLSTTTIPATTGNYTNISATTQWNMNVGDYVECFAGHDQGSSILLRTESAFSPEFMMVRNQ